jgi:hypothetical protein
MLFLYATVASTISVLFFARLPFHRERLELGAMVYGTAHRPYAYRVLVPGLVRAGVVASDAVFARPGGARADNPVARLGHRLMHDVAAPSESLSLSHEYGILFILTVLCLVGFGLTLRASIRLLYPGYPRFVSDLAPLLGIVVIPLVFFRESNLVYDPMTLFLVALCVDLIARRSHAAYLVAFAFAALNKETAILLPLLFLLREAGRPARGTLGLTAVQLALFAAVRLNLQYVMRNRPGGVVEWHLDHNLLSFGEPGFYVKTLPAILPLVVLVAYGWSRKPGFLRRGLLATAVPLIAATFFMGVLGEIRDYYEAYPLVFLLAVPAAVEVFGVESPADPDPSA